MAGLGAHEPGLGRIQLRGDELPGPATARRMRPPSAASHGFSESAVVGKRGLMLDTATELKVPRTRTRTTREDDKEDVLIRPSAGRPSSSLVRRIAGLTSSSSSFLPPPPNCTREPLTIQAFQLLGSRDGPSSLVMAGVRRNEDRQRTAQQSRALSSIQTAINAVVVFPLLVVELRRSGGGRPAGPQGDRIKEEEEDSTSSKWKTKAKRTRKSETTNTSATNKGMDDNGRSMARRRPSFSSSSWLRGRRSSSFRLARCCCFFTTRRRCFCIVFLLPTPLPAHLLSRLLLLTVRKQTAADILLLLLLLRAEA